MPLIILTGHPSSGKTHRANQIRADFESRISSSDANTKRKVVIVPSHHSARDPTSSTDEPERISPDQSSNLRDQLYNLSSAEKVARAEEFSAIKRALNKNDVVIADGLNYIKGFRYQLWCEAKAAATRCVVVHVAAREDECEAWNRERIQAWGWEFSSEENPQDYQVEEMKVGGVNVRVGRNVMGELEPESHTAIYGDKVIDYNGGRSRSSSMGGGISDDDDDDDDDDEDEDSKTTQRKSNGDAMTLKSLYITDAKIDSQKSSRDTVNPIGLLSDEQPKGQTKPTGSPVESVPPSPSPPPPKSALPYAPATLKSLLMRYEPPSPFTRWDTPLFTVPTSDPHPPCESIWTAIFPTPTRPPSKKALSQQSTQARSQSTNIDTSIPPTIVSATAGVASSPPPPIVSQVDPVRQHAATILPKATTSDALQVLESATADVVKTILSAARDQGISNGEGGELTVTIPIRPVTSASGVAASDSAPGTTTRDGPHDKHGDDQVTLTLHLPINTPLSQPMLQRLRRKYTQIQRGSIAHGQGYVSGRRDVVGNFALFLQSEWDA